MRLIFSRAVGALVVLLTCAGAARPFADSGSVRAVELRPFTVAESIGLRRIPWPVRRQILDGTVFSPDRSFFYIVTERGNLETGARDFELLIYRTVLVEGSLREHEAPAPDHVIRFSSTSNRPAISEVRWSTDSTYLSFLAEQPGGTPQVFTFRPANHRSTRLTNRPGGIFEYDLNDYGLIALGVREHPPGVRNADATDLLITDESLYELTRASGWQNVDVYAAFDTLFSRHLGGELAMLEEDPTPMHSAWRGIWLSPDGRYAVTVRQPSVIPPSWAQYRTQYQSMSIEPGENRPPWRRPYWVAQFFLIDLDRHRASPIVDAPLGYAIQSPSLTTALWSEEGNTVVLTNTMLPLEGDEASVAQRSRHAAVIAIDVRSGSVSDVMDLPEAGRRLAAVHWAQDGLCLTFEPFAAVVDADSAAETLVAKRSAVGWTTRRASGGECDQLVQSVDLRLQEQMNSPPRVMVRDRVSGRHGMLLDLNPQLGRIARAQATRIVWTATDGRQWTGALLVPGGRTPPRGFPLVIQTHGYDESSFLSDGAFTTAMAAQALAARGIAVVQMQDSYDRDISSNTQEAEAYLNAYRGLVHELTGRHIVDPARVGAIGFSRTAYHVSYAVTHAPELFAAATIADGLNGGYLQYVASQGSSAGSVERTMASLNGGQPFEHEGLESWLQRSPPFNTDRVRAPIRLEEIGSPISQWELFALLRAQGKPVEFVLFPDGDHPLVKSRERYVSQQGNVDWFAFWLLGLEDPDPVKVAQYLRWRQMRQERCAHLTGSAAPWYCAPQVAPNEGTR